MLRRMRWLWLAVVLLAAGSAGARMADAQTYVSGSFRSGGGSSISISYFYDSLAPYGRWTNYGSFGYCWTPSNVMADWRPYSDGDWVYTDYGWTWVDNEPWGWGPMHYGRWVYADDIGWLWVPGTTWAPAWVAWSSYDNYVGWAPLPPDYGWNVGVSFSNFDVHRVPSNEWCFVDRRELTSTDLRSRLVPQARVAAFVPRATNLTRFSSRNGAPVNIGVDVRQIEQAGGRPVRRMQLVDAQRPENRRIAPSGNQLQMFRGRIAPAPANAAPRMADRTDVRNLRGNHNTMNPAGGHALNTINNPATRVPRGVANPSASAAQNQQRQRFDLNQARNNGQPAPRPSMRQMQQGRTQANDAQVPRNRNGYPQNTVQQLRNPRPVPSQPMVMPRRGNGGAPPANNGGARGGRPANPGNGNGNAPVRPENNGRGNDQPPPPQDQSQQQQHGNGNGHGKGHGGE